MSYIEIIKQPIEERFSFVCDCGTRYVIPYSKIEKEFNYHCPICNLLIRITKEEIPCYPTSIDQVRIEKLDHNDEK